MKRGVGILGCRAIGRGARASPTAATPRVWPRKSSIRAIISPGPASGGALAAVRLARRTAARPARPRLRGGADRRAATPRRIDRSSSSSTSSATQVLGDSTAANARRCRAGDRPARSAATRQARRTPPRRPPRPTPRPSGASRATAKPTAPPRQAAAVETAAISIAGGEAFQFMPATVADISESPLNSLRSRRSARR